MPGGRSISHLWLREARVELKAVSGFVVGPRLEGLPQRHSLSCHSVLGQAQPEAKRAGTGSQITSGFTGKQLDGTVTWAEVNMTSAGFLGGMALVETKDKND